MVSSSATLVTVFSAILFITRNASAKPVKYDQRQEGDLNVRTDVEDVVFVLVPPKDLVSAGMGLVAATAADFLKKNYGPIGPERWPLRSSSKIGFVPLEKSPYKIDLEKSEVHVKKISQPGDPNRYNFHDHKNPTKVAMEKKPSSTEAPVSSTTEVMVEKIEEVSTTTESKTVKKDLKTEEQKKEVMEDKKPEKTVTEMVKKSEGSKVKTETKKYISTTEEPPKVIGENSKDPTSIFRHEGCGPDAYRDGTGKCIYKKETK